MEASESEEGKTNKMVPKCSASEAAERNQKNQVLPDQFTRYVSPSGTGIEFGVKGL